MSDEITKAMAQAMMGEMFAPHELPITDEWLLKRYDDTAKAARIAALRARIAAGPTEKMIEAGSKLAIELEGAEDIYTAMLRAELAEAQSS